MILWKCIVFMKINMQDGKSSLFLSAKSYLHHVLFNSPSAPLTHWWPTTRRLIGRMESMKMLILTADGSLLYVLTCFLFVTISMPRHHFNSVSNPNICKFKDNEEDCKRVINIADSVLVILSLICHFCKFSFFFDFL